MPPQKCIDSGLVGHMFNELKPNQTQPNVGQSKKMQIEASAAQNKQQKNKQNGDRTKQFTSNIRLQFVKYSLYSYIDQPSNNEQHTNVHKVILITAKHSMFLVQINRKRPFYRLIVPACHVTGGRAAHDPHISPIYRHPGKCIIKKP